MVNNKKSKAESFSEWWNVFQNDAIADNYKLFRSHLVRLNLPDDPDSLMEGTYRLVSACMAYAQINGNSVEDFLSHQKYDHAITSKCKYAFTFDISSTVYGRILADDLSFIDLADLWGMPWPDYNTCGYDVILVSRTDTCDLTDDEIRHLEQIITDDLRYDYSEDDLNIFFDSEGIDGVLTVFVHERLDVEAQ